MRTPLGVLFLCFELVMGIEGDENDCLQWRMKGVRGRAETKSLRKFFKKQRKTTMFQSGTVPRKFWNEIFAGKKAIVERF